VEIAYRTLCQLFDEIGIYDFEFVFTDNHSEDETFEILERLSSQDKRIGALRFNRNYGFQRSLLTAYRHAKGDAAIQIDCDLQDPPSLIREFLAKWEQGHDVVVGLRRRRQENFLLSFGRRTFYVLLNRISDDEITPDAGDFRLIDRSVLNRLTEIDDYSPYVRGIVSSFATNLKGIEYDRAERLRGQSKFPVMRLIGFAWDGIIGHSMMPLRLATYVGLLVSVFTFGLSLFYILAAVVFGSAWPGGFATTTVLILLGTSLNAIFLGILGEYIARIYQQVRKRPIAVVVRSLNISVKGSEQ
ncbi:MAG: glycosyltransferase family 2 protein, partial [Hyphomicrobium sp.]